MRIVGTRAPGGKVYRIYRRDEHFIDEMQRIIPFLNEYADFVLIGRTEADPDVVITVGPLDPDTDAAFQERLARQLVGNSA